MARRPQVRDVRGALAAIRTALDSFEAELDLHADDPDAAVRARTLALVPAAHAMRELGIAATGWADQAARDRILAYLRANVGRVVRGDELMVVSGISEYARRIRELRVEHHWPILCGGTSAGPDRQAQRKHNLPQLAQDEYLLLADTPDEDAIDRRIPGPVRAAVLERDGGACLECGWSPLDWSPHDARRLELHHDLPVEDGGESTADNLRTLCSRCHDTAHAEARRGRRAARTSPATPAPRPPRQTEDRHHALVPPHRGRRQRHRCRAAHRPADAV